MEISGRHACNRMFSFSMLLLIGLFSAQFIALDATAGKKELFDDLSVEDYYSGAMESTKLDDVDNEAIQQLIDKFLNQGTLEGVKEEKVNKEAQVLINSSAYWRVDNLAPEYSIVDAKKAEEWLVGYSGELAKVLHQVAVAGWNYFTSASPITKQYLEEAEEVARIFLKASSRQARQFSSASVSEDPAQVSAQIQVITKEGMNALNSAELENYNKVLARINQLFTATPVCELGSKEGSTCLLKFSDLHSVLQNTPSAKDSLDWWKSARLSAGQNLTDSYAELIELTNKASKLNGFSNGGAMWRSVFELPDKDNNPRVDIQAQMENCFQQILPLYKQLHAYFRPRLASIYAGKSKEAVGVTKDGPLPIHLLKSMNGESWASHYELTRPFADTAEDEPKIGSEILENFHAQNYTVRTMFTKVYRFMKYLGFEKLPKSLWKKSLFSRNWGKDMICNPATAYDMVNGDDYRIKVCAQLGEPGFIIAHKLMAQLYYKFSSRRQPLLLKDSPNLSSALSGAFGIISRNIDYLKAQKLVDQKAERSEPSEINRLYKEAIDQLVRLPFDLVADKWRYQVFEGSLDKNSWADAWWRLRQHYQGVKAPDSNADQSAAAFDSVVSPGISQQHAPATRNFVSYVAQFQILKKLCDTPIGSSLENRTNYTFSLSQGCIPSKGAMKRIIDTLEKGASISWIDSLEEITGSRQLDAGPLLQYYEPLMAWLQNINQHEGVIIGWDGQDGGEFTQSEFPELQQTGVIGEQGQVLPSDNQIAYPGQSCKNGQDCLLDSICNGTVCICNASFFTLQIADTYNCVPDNPANAGFGTPEGGLIIALNPNENAKKTEVNNNQTNPADSADPQPDDHHKVRASSANSTLKFGLSILTCISLFLAMVSSVKCFGF